MGMCPVIPDKFCPAVTDISAVARRVEKVKIKKIGGIFFRALLVVARSFAWLAA